MNITRIKIPYKEYGNAVLSIVEGNNKSLVIVTPGQSFSSEVFFTLKIYPDSSTLADRVVESGYDIAFLDALNYGRSEGIFPNYYSRDILAEQCILAIEAVEDRYDNIFVCGFCTTANVPLIVASKKNISGALLMSPVYFDLEKQNPIIMQQYKSFLSYTGPKMALKSIPDFYERFKTVSDTLLPHHVRVDNWENLIQEKLDTYENFTERHKWPYSVDMSYDHCIYEIHNKSKGWKIEDINCPIASFKGQFDFECYRGNMHEQFLDLIRPNLVASTIVSKSTHFGMWEKNYNEWIESFISTLDKLV